MEIVIGRWLFDVIPSEMVYWYFGVMTATFACMHAAYDTLHQPKCRGVVTHMQFDAGGDKHWLDFNVFVITGWTLSCLVVSHHPYLL